MVKSQLLYQIELWLDGSEGWIRTNIFTVNSRLLYQLSYIEMEQEKGFEPSTSCMASMYSSQLNYSCFILIPIQLLMFNGADSMELHLRPVVYKTTALLTELYRHGGLLGNRTLHTMLAKHCRPLGT